MLLDACLLVVVNRDAAAAGRGLRWLQNGHVPVETGGPGEVHIGWCVMSWCLFEVESGAPAVFLWVGEGC